MGCFCLPALPSFLDHLNNFEIPPEFLDVFDEAHCPYYEGCIIAEIHDHRPIRAQAELTSDIRVEVYKIVLHPTSETIWADLCLMNEMRDAVWSEDFSLQVESKILLATEAPLCLDPSFQVTRISNTLCYGKSKPRTRRKKRRPRIHDEVTNEVAEREEYTRLLMMMDERYQRNFQPSYQIVRTLRFESETGGRKTYTLLNVYHDPTTSHYEGMLRSGRTLDTSLEGNTTKFYIGPKDVLEDYISNVKKIYGLDNKLISDHSIYTHNTAQRTQTRQGPSPDALTSVQTSTLTEPSPAQNHILARSHSAARMSSLSQPNTQPSLQTATHGNNPGQAQINPHSTSHVTSSTAPTTSLRTESRVQTNLETSAQSSIAQVLGAMSLQQIALNGNPATLQSLSELTPQQMNHLKLQLLRKKQLLMQRQMQQQQNGLNLSSTHQAQQQTRSVQQTFGRAPMSQYPALTTTSASLAAQTKSLSSETPASLQSAATRQFPLKTTNPALQGQSVALSNGVSPQMLATIAQQRTQLLLQQQLRQQLLASERNINPANLSATGIPNSLGWATYPEDGLW
ncbi:hypothetical protein K493DRAFT_337632 [Basidiobolus meristosporus CBS 931.73]|uniref:Spt20-like SEP domain-containing protein n=1 Tax=Basidiobolus meristosporus CBS 931.73 TaxID=1314790 RepID=A0A1Y1YA67_9FUNG|nr:hypothetical protein K493DRAFT_337632 [Basidiobolus meristosporus CBS 931.73]|eukprot:ORX94805.1 hypothetical protein K493DRAFT_337632 [Basidiobolus meristosporus CBS 931.73]